MLIPSFIVCYNSIERSRKVVYNLYRNRCVIERAYIALKKKRAELEKCIVILQIKMSRIPSTLNIAPIIRTPIMEEKYAIRSFDSSSGKKNGGRAITYWGILIVFLTCVSCFLCREGLNAPHFSTV